MNSVLLDITTKEDYVLNATVDVQHVTGLNHAQAAFQFTIWLKATVVMLDVFLATLKLAGNAKQDTYLRTINASLVLLIVEDAQMEYVTR